MLKELGVKPRKRLPKEFRLSITGLGDWAQSSDKGALVELFNSVDEIVFQMYQVRTHFPNTKVYVKALDRMGQKYKLGVLYRKANEIDLAGLKHLDGVVYFIQRQV